VEGSINPAFLADCREMVKGETDFGAPPKSLEKDNMTG